MCHAYLCHSITLMTKRPNLKLKTRPEGLLDSLPFDLALPARGDLVFADSGSFPDAAAARLGAVVPRRPLAPLSRLGFQAAVADLRPKL